MSDASFPLQKAVFEALKASAAVTAIVGMRIFDGVPRTAQKPYISFGPSQVTAELAEEYDGAEERFQLDAWSAIPDRGEVKRLGRAIEAALLAAPLVLTDNQRLVLLEPEQTRYLTEPDGVTQHGVLIFVARTEPTT